MRHALAILILTLGMVGCFDDGQTSDFIPCEEPDSGVMDSEEPDSGMLDSDEPEDPCSDMTDSNPVRKIWTDQCYEWGVQVTHTGLLQCRTTWYKVENAGSQPGECDVMTNPTGTERYYIQGPQDPRVAIPNIPTTCTEGPCRIEIWHHKCAPASEPSYCTRSL